MKKGIHNKFPKINQIIRWGFEKEHSPFLFAVLQTVITYTVLELLFSGTLIKIRFTFILMNLGIILSIYLLCLFLCGNKCKLGFWIGNLFFFIYFIAQFYTMDFRGAPIQFSDFNWKTIIGGVAIVPNYTFSLYSEVIIAVIVLVSEWELIRAIRFSEVTFVQKIGNLIISFCIGIVIIPTLSPTYNIIVEKKEVDFYNRKSPYRQCGHLLMFCMDAASGGVQVPEHYSIETAENIRDSVQQVKRKTLSQKPNIIVIMNESFADFQTIGSFQTDKEVTPFIDSLKENTIKGKVAVSAYGGYSCNSEYEFLTGNTMGFLPQGSTSFTQFLNQEQPSLVTALKNRGYWAIGMSACERDIWDLEEAYEYLGFDEAYFEDDWEEESPEFLRGYLKDSYMFDQIIKRFDQKTTDQPLFIWNTTMQNHGGYHSKITHNVHLIGMDDFEEKDEVEVYLTSLQKTDRAVKELITYFEQYEEPTVIAMFGDHYPHLSGFFERLFETDLDKLSLEQLSRRHETPFFVWANYEVEEQIIDEISLNYLSGIVMDVAGLEKTGYQKFLSELYQTFPVISGWGYRDKDGTLYGNRQKTNYDELLEQYQILQYNNMFDKRITNFFD